MDPELWQRAVALFEVALTYPKTMRLQWIERESGSHAAIRELAIKLLHAHERVDDTESLKTLPKFSHKPTSEHDSGDIVGNFVLLNRLGAGGMGEVWRARYADCRLEREVALKICSASPAAHDSLAAHERFVRERRFLERLEHPNIARLYDAGVAENGRAYLALELVSGDAIDEYCRLKQLTLRARVELFLQVVEATAYAHQQLILHRDLKPSNIMVDQAGVVKLLDFGVAKLIDSSAIDDVELTKLAGTALTLAYAAPEQITNQALSTATDVYALGATLYRLLTGALPYRPATDSRYALQEAILQSDAISASSHAFGAAFRAETCASAEELRHTLAGDLDSILAKALKKEPNERYSSAAAFADDLRRFLRMQPVAARPDSVFYRGNRFIRRNRLAVSAAMAAICALFIAMSIAMHQAHRATLEAAETARQLRRLETAQKFVSGLFAYADPEHAKGKPIMPGDVLRKGLADAKVLFANDPETRAGVLAQIGDIYFRMGLTEEMYEAQRARVEALRSAPVVDMVQMTDALIALGQAQADSRTLAVREAAVSTFEAAIAAAERSRGISKERSIFATALIADQHRVFQRFDQAERLSRHAVAMSREHLPPNQSTSVAALQVQALLARDRGRVDEARKLFARVIAADLESDRGAVDRFNVKRQLAALEFDAGSFLAARRQARQLLSEAEAQLGDIHANLAPLRRLVVNAAERAGLLDEAIRDAQTVLGPELSSGDSLRVGTAKMAQARALLSADVLSDVSRLLNDASTALASYPLWLNRLASLEAEYGLRIGDHARAAAAVDAGLLRAAERGQSAGREAASLHEWRGRLFVARGDYKRASNSIAEACRLRVNFQHAAHPQRLVCESMLVLLRDDLDRSRTAVELESLLAPLVTLDEYSLVSARIEDAKRYATASNDRRRLHQLDLFLRD